MPRLMAKTMTVERAEKGNPLQSKLNAFTNGKAIVSVESIAVSRTNGSDRVTILYQADKDEGATHPRIYFKVIEESNTKTKDVEGKPTVVESTELQTKVNAFTGGDNAKSSEFKVVASAVVPGQDSTLVVLAHTKPAREASEDAATETAAAAA